MSSKGTAPPSAAAADPPRRTGRRQQRIAAAVLLTPFTVLLVAVFLIPVGYRLHSQCLGLQPEGEVNLQRALTLAVFMDLRC